MKPQNKKEQYFSVFVLLLIVLIFFISRESYPLFYSNQNTYFPHGLVIGGKESLINDWYSNTTPLHISFTLLISCLESLHFLKFGVVLFESFLTFCMLVGIVLLINWLIKDLKVDIFDQNTFKQYTLLIISLFIVIFLNNLTIYSFFFEPIYEKLRILDFWQEIWEFSGVANQYVYGGYFQPSEFGVLIFLAIILVAYKKNMHAVVCLGLSSLFHSSYMLHTTIIVSIIVVSTLFRKNKPRCAIKIIIVYSLIILPVLLYTILIFYNSSMSQEAINVLANYRIPHHVFPSYWWNKYELTRLTIMVIASIILFLKKKNYLFSQIIILSTTYILMSILIGYITNNAKWGLLFPWRASAYIFPISLIVLFSYVFFQLIYLLRFNKKSNLNNFLRSFLILSITISIISILVFDKNNEKNIPREYNNLVEKIKLLTQPEDVILIPIEWQDFRLLTDRAVYIDHKSHPYTSKEILEWKDRIDKVENFYRFETPSERITFCFEENLDFYVIRTNKIISGEKPVFSIDGFSLVRCE